MLRQIFRYQSLFIKWNTGEEKRCTIKAPTTKQIEITWPYTQSKSSTMKKFWLCSLIWWLWARTLRWSFTQDHLLFSLHNPAHPKQTRKITLSSTYFWHIKGVSVFQCFTFPLHITLVYFSCALGRLPKSSFISLSLQIWGTPKPPLPERSLKCNLKFNLLHFSCSHTSMGMPASISFRGGFGNLSQPQNCFTNCLLPPGKPQPSLTCLMVSWTPPLLFTGDWEFCSGHLVTYAARLLFMKGFDSLLSPVFV